VEAAIWESIFVQSSVQVRKSLNSVASIPLIFVIDGRTEPDKKYLEFLESLGLLLGGQDEDGRDILEPSPCLERHARKMFRENREAELSSLRDMALLIRESEQFQYLGEDMQLADKELVVIMLDQASSSGCFYSF
jgi:hypothetical protein